MILFLFSGWLSTFDASDKQFYPSFARTRAPVTGKAIAASLSQDW